MPTAGKDGNHSNLRVALKSVSGYKKLNPDVIAPLSKQRPFKPLTSLLIHVNLRCSQPLEILRSLTDNVLRGSWDHILNGQATSPAALLMSGLITNRPGGGGECHTPKSTGSCQGRISPCILHGYINSLTQPVGHSGFSEAHILQQILGVSSSSNGIWR